MTQPRSSDSHESPRLARGATRVLLLSIGFACLGLGAIGVLLPVLPTTPFVLLAVACFARSSSKWHRWLTGHAVLGPPIRDWKRHGVIRTRAKVIATVMILSLGLPTILWVPWLELSLAISLVFTCVLTFIWTRPSLPRRDPSAAPTADPSAITNPIASAAEVVEAALQGPHSTPPGVAAQNERDADLQLRDDVTEPEGVR